MSSARSMGPPPAPARGGARWKAPSVRVTAVLASVFPGLGHVHVGRFIPAVLVQIGLVASGFGALLALVRVRADGWNVAAAAVIVGLYWALSVMHAVRLARRASELPLPPFAQRVAPYAAVLLLPIGGLLPVAELVAREFVVRRVVIADARMSPALVPGETVLADRLAYGFTGDLSHGDVIAFRSQSGSLGPRAVLVSRVVALSGEWVGVRGGRVYVDGRVRDPWSLLHDPLPEVALQEVPRGHVFVLGDLRALSLCYSGYGMVALDDVIGRAALRLPESWLPLGRTAERRPGFLRVVR